MCSSATFEHCAASSYQLIVDTPFRIDISITSPTTMFFSRRFGVATTAAALRPTGVRYQSMSGGGGATPLGGARSGSFTEAGDTMKLLRSMNTTSPLAIVAVGAGVIMSMGIFTIYCAEKESRASDRTFAEQQWDPNEQSAELAVPDTSEKKSS
jgi:hypothetical protein